jgi:catechol 2,3-dioxygenase-like lactoylglutathione lyase family enzyme
MSKVVLWVSDLKAQIDFYSKLFDVKRGFIGDDFAEVSCESNSVLLHTLPEEYRAETPLAAQLRHQTEVAIKPVFTVSNLAAAQNRVADTFATFSPGTIDFGPFVYQDVVDPEGNVIQLQQRIGN